MLTEKHDTLAWLVQHAAATMNGEGRTDTVPKKDGQELSTSGWRQAKARVGSAHRVVGVKASSWDCTALVNVQTTTLFEHQMAWESGTGIQARARRKCLLLSVTRLPWDRKRREPTIRVSMPRTPMPERVPLPREPRAGGDGGQGGVLARDGCAS